MSEKNKKGRTQMSFKGALFVTIGYGIACAIGFFDGLPISEWWFLGIGSVFFCILTILAYRREKNERES
ncbi:MAG: hypothetical protein ACI31W_02410 [Lactococcus sp.]